MVAGVIDARREVELLQRLARPMNANNFSRPIGESAIRIGVARMLVQLRNSDRRALANVRAEMAAIRRVSGKLNRE